MLPAAVPGIYARINCGQFVTNFKALDAKGAALAASQADSNSWKLPPGTRRLEYDVDDSWESMATSGYKSPGTSFKADTSYVLNHNSYIGYFDGAERPYTIRYNKPKGFYGASQLSPKKDKDTIDVFTAATYKELVDAPILYARPDTTSLAIAGSRVRIAAFSTNGQKIAPEIAKRLQDQLEKTAELLGGKLPMQRYTYLFYMADGPAGSFLGDGLEHRASSLCLMQGISVEAVAPFMQDLAAHEFFHTVTPLWLQSDIAAKFDFKNPVLDKHLWFYEGMPEYLSMLLPVRLGEKTVLDFSYAISQKVKDAAKYDPKLTLADMSRQAITRQDQYGNFYAKGALVCMALDIKLRSAQLGTSGIPESLVQLMTLYGPQKQFKEKEFYDVLGRVTQPDYYYFLRDIVDENKPFPLADILLMAGFHLDPATGDVVPSDEASALQRTLRQWWIRK